MNRFLYSVVLSLTLSVSMIAQAKLFNSGDKVIVQISSTYGKVYVHEMSPQQTVYSLAKTFDQRMQDVESVNPGINFNAMKVGQKIRVPFLAASMVKNPNDILQGGEYVNVYYKIRPKDNLYRIAKIYFDTSIENLMEINRTSSMDLKADDLIKVGWMPIGTTPKAKAPTYSYSTVVNKAEDRGTAAQNKPIAPSQSVTTPVVPAKAETVQRNSNSSSRKPIERRSRRSEPKKQGFFSKIFGSKNKKKKREEKAVKEVVEMSERLGEKNNPATMSSPTVSGNITQNPTVQPEERAQFQSVVKVPTESTEISTTEVETAGDPLPEYVFKSEKGIAIWNQTSTNSQNMFALHPTAAVGSYIEITNPMMNKTVQAKVIGNIPPRTYTDDVSIVVSPKVATSLGVVDRRFAVRVKYREE